MHFLLITCLKIKHACNRPKRVNKEQIWNTLNYVPVNFCTSGPDMSSHSVGWGVAHWWGKDVRPLRQAARPHHALHLWPQAFPWCIWLCPLTVCNTPRTCPNPTTRRWAALNCSASAHGFTEAHIILELPLSNLVTHLSSTHLEQFALGLPDPYTPGGYSCNLFFHCPSVWFSYALGFTNSSHKYILCFVCDPKDPSLHWPSSSHLSSSYFVLQSHRFPSWVGGVKWSFRLSKQWPGLDSWEKTRWF